MLTISGDESNLESGDITGESGTHFTLASPSQLLPEQSLWIAVICQALLDASRGKSRAIEWLLLGKEDFTTVCSLAGVSPNVVRTAGRRVTKFYKPD